ncbi:MAG: hypothetical protein KQJ78_11060 [Deltaproteobacteria bacterium]|nr:hypothetical protein [Deltaproteobacteria bacterium]
MAVHDAVIGSISAQEIPVLFGPGPHVVRNEPLLAGLAALAAGLLVALDAAGLVVPWDASQTFAAGAGDGAEKDFAGVLGPVEPGSVSVTDGTETFADDGFGALTGDAGGTGSVNYQTGSFAATFNVAPLAEAPVTAGYKPVLRGVLLRPAVADAGDCEVVIHGKVVQAQLTVGVAAPAAPTADQMLSMERLGLWPQ